VSANWVLTVFTGVMMTSSLSGSGTWVGSASLRVGSAHPCEEDACDAWRAWAVTSSARANGFDV
jgi:hypothetical protein